MLTSRQQALAENLLLVLNTFILFLLIFAPFISIPVWLEPLGRMHPLILHFPIVLVLLGMLMEFFRFRKEFAGERLYQEFSRFLLLSGAILASLTVIMGLFLAHEPGYTGQQILGLHKWTGVSISFFAWGIYHFRNHVWYTERVAQSAALVTSVVLIIAGHYGATLTHGDNFVLAPVTRLNKGTVALDQARVYEDLIQPVFDKCTSCHNADKNKGKLDLTNIKGILAGSKSGALFIPGNPAMSLIIQRIHLAPEDKKHMPPVEKTQLTADESRLLYYWIMDRAEHKKKVVELAPTDSLRVLATALLKPAQETEQYAFAAADDRVLSRLRSNYRIIYPVAAGVPALAVNIYNRSQYRPKELEDLLVIKEQVVALNLNKMPVHDAELKTIAQFQNLRTLNLNNTELSGKTLSQLEGLSHLRSLFLSGAQLLPQSLEVLGRLKHLQELALWNTGLETKLIAQFQKSRPEVRLLAGFHDDGRKLKLTAPQLKTPSAVFADSFTLSLFNPIKGTEIRYTTDMSVPDSLHSAVYHPGLVFRKDVTIRSRAFKAGWLGSDTTSFSFFKSTFKPDSAWLTTTPRQFYTADGAQTLVDQRLGNANTVIDWLGYKNTDMNLICMFKKAHRVSRVSLHCIEYPDALWVNPSVVEVWGGSSLSQLSLLGTTRPDTARHKKVPVFTEVTCEFRPHEVRYLKVIAKTDFTLAPKPDPVKPKVAVRDDTTAKSKDSAGTLIAKAKVAGAGAIKLALKTATAATLANGLPPKVAPKPVLVKTKGTILFDEIFIN